MTILVTGGTGFLGKCLVRRLVDEGREVRVLVRDERRLGGLPVQRLDVVRGDLLDAAALERAVQGAEVVIHAAALVKRWARDRGAFERVNARGTAELVEAALRAGVRKFFYVSSFFALGCSDAAPDAIGDETLPRDPKHVHTLYERSKYQASLEIGRLVAAGAPVVSLYPCVIYGPGELTEGNIVTGMLRDHLSGKLPGIPGSGERKWTYAFVEDVVSGILQALEKGAAGERYILGGETATTNEFFELFHEISGCRPPRFKLPFWVLKPVAWLEEWKARCFGQDPKITRAEVETYRHHWAYDSAKARRELGYRSRSLREGLEETYRWLIDREPELEVKG